MTDRPPIRRRKRAPAASGVLSYDADGNRGGAAVPFAILTNHAVISAADFLLV